VGVERRDGRGKLSRDAETGSTPSTSAAHSRRSSSSFIPTIERTSSRRSAVPPRMPEASSSNIRIVLPDGQTAGGRPAADVVATKEERQPPDGRRPGHHERKEAEERLLAGGRYRNLVEQLPLASYVEQLDAESGVYISPQIADLVGYTAEEWIADSNFFASVLHPDDREHVLAGFAAMHESGASSMRVPRDRA